ncbi:hypothetical protein FVE85_2261 [Porphyridium purpureum]|uniref:Uncharacterized protein n=1 Tax=Porphyridium purpureum TaxID=35688 RepID=A0A5J4YXM7_PORPP|nr:hypothetical protein FVE85_2261 [Porphyridium purpureum]|eukprot:POR4667..scf209_3
MSDPRRRMSKPRAAAAARGPAAAAATAAATTPQRQVVKSQAEKDREYAEHNVNVGVPDAVMTTAGIKSFVAMLSEWRGLVEVNRVVQRFVDGDEIGNGYQAYQAKCKIVSDVLCRVIQEKDAISTAEAQQKIDEIGQKKIEEIAFNEIEAIARRRGKPYREKAVKRLDELFLLPERREFYDRLVKLCYPDHSELFKSMAKLLPESQFARAIVRDGERIRERDRVKRERTESGHDAQESVLHDKKRHVPASRMALKEASSRFRKEIGCCRTPTDVANIPTTLMEWGLRMYETNTQEPTQFPQALSTPTFMTQIDLLIRETISMKSGVDGRAALVLVRVFCAAAARLRKMAADGGNDADFFASAASFINLLAHRSARGLFLSPRPPGLHLRASLSPSVEWGAHFGELALFLCCARAGTIEIYDTGALCLVNAAVQARNLLDPPLNGRVLFAHEFGPTSEYACIAHPRTSDSKSLSQSMAKEPNSMNAESVGHDSSRLIYTFEREMYAVVPEALQLLQKEFDRQSSEREAKRLLELPGVREALVWLAFRPHCDDDVAIDLDSTHSASDSESVLSVDAETAIRMLGLWYPGGRARQEFMFNFRAAVQLSCVTIRSDFQLRKVKQHQNGLLTLATSSALIALGVLFWLQRCVARLSHQGDLTGYSVQRVNDMIVRILSTFPGLCEHGLTVIRVGIQKGHARGTSPSRVFRFRRMFIHMLAIFCTANPAAACLGMRLVKRCEAEGLDRRLALTFVEMLVEGLLPNNDRIQEFTLKQYLYDTVSAKSVDPFRQKLDNAVQRWLARRTFQVQRSVSDVQNLPDTGAPEIP